MIDKNGIWGLDIAKKRHKCDVKLVDAIWDIYKPISLADIGCGNGAYCKLFLDKGSLVVHGYEGTKDVNTLGYYSNISTVDLTTKLKLNLKYDLVLCLEVGEHIPKLFEDIFLSNLISFVGKTLIISWADINQYSASGHVNPQSEEYVKNIFVMSGFSYNAKVTQYLRNNSEFNWFKKNILVFELEQ